jgi:glycosyltransferase involved in cell wall biosynthesis
MRVVHLSTSDLGGGAARAAFRVHTGLLRLGVDSKMLVLKRQSDQPSVLKMTWHTDPLTKIRRAIHSRQIARDFEPYKSAMPPSYELFSDDRSDAAYDLVREIPDCDILNLHWVAGFIDHENFFPKLPRHLPIVWRLADMGALTGGCHYDAGCGKFTQSCGACPALASSEEKDLSRKIWLRKHRAIDSIETSRMHLVGTSRWIAGEAKRSSLLGRFDSTIIPNALDTEVFCPMDKAAARDQLGVPRDKKVILFVADSAENKRKGFDYLLRALQSLDGRSDLFLLSVGGVSPQVGDLPLLHLGRIADDRRLCMAYNAADVFVIPSLQESFGQTVTESLASGTPVVGFDTGGIPDMVRPGVTGYLAKTGEVAELAGAICRVLDDPQAAEEMGQHCRQIAENEYALDRQARTYRTLYENLVK